MDVKKLFIELTKQLIPYKSEHLVLPFLPEGIETDEVGNYRITIGETRTMFTCHLDSYTEKLVNVTHKILTDSKGLKIGTTGKTPLGADCKAGVTIMINMINHNVPGCYYFFIGEESITGGGGCKGSRAIFKANSDYFKQFDRCIAFDRHGYDSIISSQRGEVCCSDAFVKQLSAYFSANNLQYRKDPTGKYTDSAVFMYIIPEVTNISTGGFYEHTNKEFQNLTFLEKLCNATIKIPWEELPVVRIPIKEKPKKTQKVNVEKNFKGKRTYKGSGGFLSDLENTLDTLIFGEEYVRRKRMEEKTDNEKFDSYQLKEKNRGKRPRIKKYNNFNRR